jgi:lipoprotein-anchoring transpeptidase ErfK/SrfK
MVNMPRSSYTNNPRQVRTYGTTAPALPYYRVNQRESRWQFLMPVLILAALVILPVLCLATGYAAYRTSDLIFPGVAVGSVPIGGLSRVEAEKRVDAVWNGEHRLTITDGLPGGYTGQASPIEMGLWADPKTSVELAYQVGRGPDGFRELASLIWTGSSTLPPHVVFSPAVSRDRLSRLATGVDRPAVNATLRLENGLWTPVPAVYGTSLDIEATLQQAAAQPQTILASGYFPLATRQVAPHVPDPAPLVERLEAALSRPLKIRAYDPITDQRIEWAVPREVFESWVTVEFDGDQSVFGLDSQHLDAYLQEWQSTLGPGRILSPFAIPPELPSMWLSGDPFTVLVQHLPRSYTVQPGETLLRVAFQVGMPYWKIQQANPGVDLERLSPGQVLTIPSPNDMLPLPVVLDKRIVINISQQRMWTYENGSLRSETIISTGISRSPTYPGVYQVQTHEINAYASVWDLHMPHFMGIYEGWPGFMNGIHGLPTLSSGMRLWANVLGSPTSYGCIILSLPDAEDLYNWAEAGVIVEIRN